jgi:hypothetical protein
MEPAVSSETSVPFYIKRPSYPARYKSLIFTSYLPTADEETRAFHHHYNKAAKNFSWKEGFTTLEVSPLPFAVAPLLAYVNQSEERASSKDRRITVNKNG